jgi:hypothetical protein
LLRETSQLRLLPNVISFFAGISACVSAGISACEKGVQWDVATSLLWEMPQLRRLPNEIRFNTGISACEKLAQWEAVSIAGISACEKGAQWEVASSLLWEMPQLKRVPDAIRFNVGISACDKGA